MSNIPEEQGAGCLTMMIIAFMVDGWATFKVFQGDFDTADKVICVVVMLIILGGIMGHLGGSNR
jgi:hypothetical protein